MEDQQNLSEPSPELAILSDSLRTLNKTLRLLGNYTGDLSRRLDAVEVKVDKLLEIAMNEERRSGATEDVRMRKLDLGERDNAGIGSRPSITPNSPSNKRPLPSHSTPFPPPTRPKTTAASPTTSKPTPFRRILPPAFRQTNIPRRKNVAIVPVVVPQARTAPLDSGQQIQAMVEAQIQIQAQNQAQPQQMQTQTQTHNQAQPQTQTQTQTDGGVILFAHRRDTSGNRNLLDDSEVMLVDGKEEFTDNDEDGGKYLHVQRTSEADETDSEAEIETQHDIRLVVDACEDPTQLITPRVSGTPTHGGGCDGRGEDERPSGSRALDASQLLRDMTNDDDEAREQVPINTADALLGVEVAHVLSNVACNDGASPVTHGPIANVNTDRTQNPASLAGAGTDHDHGSDSDYGPMNPSPRRRRPSRTGRILSSDLSSDEELFRPAAVGRKRHGDASSRGHRPSRSGRTLVSDDDDASPRYHRSSLSDDDASPRYHRSVHSDDDASPKYHRSSRSDDDTSPRYHRSSRSDDDTSPKHHRSSRSEDDTSPRHHRSSRTDDDAFPRHHRSSPLPDEEELLRPSVTSLRTYLSDDDDNEEDITLAYDDEEDESVA